MYVQESSWKSRSPPNYGFVMALLSMTHIVVLRQQMAGIRSRSIATEHRPPLVLYHDDNDKLIACSIPNACMRMHIAIREIYVPDAYRVHDAVLRRCRKFVNSPSFPNSFDPVLRYYEANSSNPVLRDSLRNPQDVDVLGSPFNSQYHMHFAHFAADFVEYAMMPANEFVNNPKMSSLLRPLCVFRTKSELCDSAHLPRAPRFVLATKRSHGWITHLLTKISRSNATLHRAPYTSHKVATCFRSVITSPQRFDTEYAARDQLLRSVGVKREAPRAASHIVVLSRGQNGSRAMPTALKAQLKNELYTQLGKHQLTDTTVEFVENIGRLGFDGQIALMQRADVLVSAHGAELSNALFLKRGSTVIEIFPFGWVFRNFFTNYFDAVHADRVEFYAPPDPERFMRCMRIRNRPEAELALYQRQAERYYRARNRSQRIAAADFKVPTPLHMGACVRYQRTTFSPQVLARVIVEKVLERQSTRKTQSRFVRFFRWLVGMGVYARVG